MHSLCTLASARTDAPDQLPDPSTSNLAPDTLTLAAPSDTVEENLPAIIHSALHQDLVASPPQEHAAILNRVRDLQTRAEAQKYMADVQNKVRPLRSAAAGH